jgi:hypothetical protein
MLILAGLLAVLSDPDPALQARSPLPTSLAEEFLPEMGDADSSPDEEALDPEPQYVPPRPRTPAASSLQFSIGPAGGYLHAHGADRGTWFVGGQARLHILGYFAIEASVTFHENSYEGGDVHVTQYPVQLSGMIYPFPAWILSPYLVGGGGWYYSRVTYSGALSGISNQTEHTFGAHGGVGADVRLGATFTLDADLRYIFLDPTGTQVKNGDFNYWQVTFGVNVNF